MKTASTGALRTLILFAAFSGAASARLPAMTVPLPAPSSLSHVNKQVPVPAALQGRWAADFGIFAEECEPEFPDGFRWSIDARADKFHYWESRGTPTKVRQLSANRFVIDLDVEGEGHEWKKRSIFTLSSGGRVLTVDDSIPEMNLPYRRPYGRDATRQYKTDLSAGKTDNLEPSLDSLHLKTGTVQHSLQGFGRGHHANNGLRSLPPGKFGTGNGAAGRQTQLVERALKPISGNGNLNRLVLAFILQPGCLAAGVGHRWHVITVTARDAIAIECNVNRAQSSIVGGEFRRAYKALLPTKAFHARASLRYLLAKSSTASAGNLATTLAVSDPVIGRCEARAQIRDRASVGCPPCLGSVL